MIVKKVVLRQSAGKAFISHSCSSLFVVLFMDGSWFLIFLTHIDLWQVSGFGIFNGFSIIKISLIANSFSL